MDIQSLYQNAIKFACFRHIEKNHKVPGTELPYVVHLSNVAMEVFMASFNSENFDLDFAVQVALLHDTLEDTETSYNELKENFGKGIADAVLSLSKDKNLPLEHQMQDSLTRIKRLQKEVWAVKLADRITNLQPPPAKWSNEKRMRYLEEAQLVHRELQEGNEYLAERLKRKIEEYCSKIICQKPQ